MKVKSESEVAQSCPTVSDPMDCSPPGSSIHGIFQARVLEWDASSTLRLLGKLEGKDRKSLQNVGIPQLVIILILILNLGELIYFPIVLAAGKVKATYGISHCPLVASSGCLFISWLHIFLSSGSEKCRHISGSRSVDWSQRQSHQG